MAQDFHAFFGLGESDTAIGSVDADGVALAAIQGLNGRFEDRWAVKDAEITELKDRNRALEERLARLGAMINAR